MTPEQAELAARYLAAGDRLGQSGFSGGAERWERLRRPIAVAIDRSGSVLDVGCANGALLEDLVQWCGGAGVGVDPWGLDVSPDLVALAARRCPWWSDRFFVGDAAATWSPPRRWDYVRTELGYVDEEFRGAYVDRLLAEFVAPGGSLLVCEYASRNSSTARPVDVVPAAGPAAYLQFSFPPYWHDDGLRALDHFRDASGRPDGQLTDAGSTTSPLLCHRNSDRSSRYCSPRRRDRRSLGCPSRARRRAAPRAR